MSENRTAGDIIFEEYKKIVTAKYPNKLSIWPILSGHDLLNGEYDGYIICIFKQTGNASMTSCGIVDFNSSIIGYDKINDSNIETIRENLRGSYCSSNKDSVVILNIHGTNLQNELMKLLIYHEIVMGIIKMKIFLSHKGADKEMIREYKSTLTQLGFDVWLDEDAMPAGTVLHKGILQGFKDSCAAVFFITPNYIDEGFLETEINYAITEKMSKKEKFSIIPLVFEKDGKTGQVPDLLKQYVWKQPQNDMQAFQEIISALPIKLGTVSYK